MVQSEPEIQPMKTGKAKGWIGEYNWVSLPITEDNKYKDNTSLGKDWCLEHFGKSGHRWFEKENKFFFKNEKDMTMFILRWCS